VNSEEHCMVILVLVDCTANLDHVESMETIGSNGNWATDVN
jgi:hypothetical protein